ncbi:hypothetical protein E2C01_094664 [Portunus trituberculatus]|uniref:Uncharacterized protein n=1 Tax=Portunus trituberculatus TaxID=210409 RepID=A0A5B7JR24_PORTR|nr:hypothetical protein [Portunus trituberculatus]
MAPTCRAAPHVSALHSPARPAPPFPAPHVTHCPPGTQARRVITSPRRFLPPSTPLPCLRSSSTLNTRLGRDRTGRGGRGMAPTIMSPGRRSLANTTAPAKHHTQAWRGQH